MPNNDAIVHEMKPVTVTESLATDRQTGWFAFTDLGKKVFVRRINATYSSTDDITFKLYVDGDSDNESFTGTFRANDGETGAIVSATIGPTITTLPTSSTTKLRSGDWIKVSSEIIKVIEAGTTSHTVQRGMRGTTAVVLGSHPLNTDIYYANHPFDSFKIGNRAKYAQVQLSTPTTTNPCEISRLEIEYE